MSRRPDEHRLHLTRQRTVRWPWLLCACIIILLTGMLTVAPLRSQPIAHPTTPAADLPPTETNAPPPAKVPPAPPVKTWHPKHIVKVWYKKYRGVTYQIVQLPRCEHLETIITYEPAGETLKRAKARMKGIASMTGSFHNPQSMALADFLQRNGTVISDQYTGRHSLVIEPQGRLEISGDYVSFKHAQGVSALALGQRLVPLKYDGFSKAFMNQTTQRMGLGLGDNYLYIVSATTSIWRFAEFIDTQLPCTVAINSDGGHVLRGKAPVHVIFRWK